MSTDIHEGSLYVTRLCGPADEGPDRARWQFTLVRVGAPYVQLRRDEVVVLAAALANSAADIPTPDYVGVTCPKCGMREMVPHGGDFKCRVCGEVEVGSMYRNAQAFDAGCYLDCLDYPACPCSAEPVMGEQTA